MSAYSRVVVVVVIVLLGGALATPAQAQCPLMSPVFCYPYTGFMVTMTVNACFAQLSFITNTMTMEYLNCMPSPTPTDTSNVVYCGYIMGQRRLFVFRDTSAAPTAHCQVTCDCGVLRIDEGDGLPVELMSFGPSEAAAASSSVKEETSMTASSHRDR